MNQIAEKQEQELAPVQDNAGSIIHVIERAAKDPNVDVDKMERLMGMYERMQAKTAEQQYHAGLSRLQSDLPEITERGEIKHGDKVISTYARWEDINRQIKPILREHGFSLSFRVDTDDKVRIEGVLSHEAGHSERTSITLPADTSGSKNPVQAVASSVSYGKRYTAGCLLNLTSAGEDDDGQAAGAPEKITDDQAADIEALIEEVKADKTKFLAYLSRIGKVRLEKVADIPAKMHRDAVSALEAKRKRQ